jgi:hypothetical protein
MPYGAPLTINASCVVEFPLATINPNPGHTVYQTPLPCGAYVRQRMPRRSPLLKHGYHEFLSLFLCAV